jgi:ubiquinone/menaquinone biosynthesis C-methylase UbiE
MNYYDQISEGYDELHKEEQLKKVKIIIKELNIKDEKVLDIGCGTAFYSNLFKNYTGIDNSKGMLKQSKAKVILGDAENLPFEDKSFDIVISITAVQNFKDVEKAIKEIKRIAKNKIAISILKKSKKLQLLRKLLKDFKEIEQEKDIIFLKVYQTQIS